MNQSKLMCDGCGKQFDNREELQQHRKQCAALKASGAQGQKTRTAGGQTEHS